MKNPIIVALDVDDPKVAAGLVEKLQPYVGGFKVGPRLTLRSDRGFANAIRQAGIFMFDHKFLDIPSTTEASVKVAAELGADWVTVHALNGPVCLKRLAEAEKDIRKTNPDFRVLAVTVLTSFTQQTLPPIWREEPIAQSVRRLAESASAQGIRSFVCSPAEVADLKNAVQGGFFVIPGVRPAGSKTDDQERVATPAETLKAGASALVIGRPIIEAEDPAQAAREIAETLKF